MMKATVLILDDKAQKLKGAKESMEKFGLAVELISEPNEGVDRIRENGIDCIHLDLRFEGHDKNGVDVLTEIDDVKEDIPIFVVSAFGKQYEKMAKEKKVDKRIERWYVKGEFDVPELALDTIQSINDYYERKNMSKICKQVRGFEAEGKEELSNALKSCPGILRPQPVNPEWLIEYLKDTIEKILRRGSKHLLFQEHCRRVFRTIRNHIMEAHVGNTPEHNYLALELRHLAERDSRDEIVRDGVRELGPVLEILGRREISEDALDDAIRCLEDGFRVKVGLGFRKEKDSKEYLALVKRSEYDEDLY